jgi:hypothetical protein
MKVWILLLFAAVFSSDEYNPYDVKSTDVVEPEPGKYPVARKCVKVMFYAGCVYGMCQLYCTYTQPGAYCGEQSYEIQQAKSYALIEAAKAAKNYVVCGTAIPACTLTNKVWNKCKDIYNLAYDKGKSSEESVMESTESFMESTESFMECMDLNPKDMEECNFHYTRKNRLLKIKNEEDAKLNSEKLSLYLRLNASELCLYKQIGEKFVGVGKYINLKQLENAVTFDISLCKDVPPHFSHFWNNTCAKQKSSGKCLTRKQENSYMCRKTCGLCDDVLSTFSTVKEGLGHSFKLKIERENGKVEHVFQTKDELDAILNPSKINSSIKVEEPDRQTGDGKPTTSNKDKPTTSDKNEQSDKGTQKKDGTSAKIVKTKE